ncbi:MAG: RDD family protein [Ferruginibacter sp.]
MQNEQPEQTPDLLSNFETHIVRASTGKRFANYIIDLMLFYLLIVIFGIIMAITNPDAFENLARSSGFNLLDRLYSLLLYGTYMFVVEAIFKGKSLGKLITGTRAVNLDGSRISTTTALGRGFSRSVPFNEFSALGSPANPWHDRWNKTLVMDEKLSTIMPAIE